MKRDFGFEGIAALSQLAPQLKELHLADCFRIANMAVKAIGRGLKNLQALTFRNCPNLQEAAMSKFFFFNIIHEEEEESTVTARWPPSLIMKGG